jgi:TPR repeat protein
MTVCRVSAFAGRLAVLLAVSSAGCRKASINEERVAPAVSAHEPIAPAQADPELAEAERAARAKLGELRAALSRSDSSAGNFELAVYVTEGALGERLWLGDVRRVADGFQGSVRSVPATLKAVSRGQVLNATAAQVVDWAYEERGQSHGGETRRIAAKHKRQAELDAALPQCADKRFADGCAALGESYATGTIGEVRADVAYLLFTKSCDGGSSYGCNSAGWAKVHGRGTTKDLSAAAAFFARACTTGDEHPFACDSRGFALVSGLAGTPLDLALGPRLLQKACTRGLSQSCLLLELLKAKHLWAGPKYPLACDVNFAEQVARCSGDDKDPEACFLAGSAFETGVCGARRSAARSAELLDKAAEFGARWSARHAP